MITPSRLALLGRPSRLVGLALLVIGLALPFWSADEGPPWRTVWWDTLQRLAPRDRGAAADAPAVIVAIDEETMRRNGAWPWPRNRLAELVDRVRALGAAAVVLDIVIDNPDPQSPARIAAEYRARGVPGAAAALEPLGDTDAVLFSTLRSVPAILPVAGIAGTLPGEAGRGCAFPPPAVSAPTPLPPLAGTYDAAASPLPHLLERRPGLAEIGLGAITFRAGRGFVVRRVEAVQRICGELVLMPGPEALRIATGGFFSIVRPTRTGLEIVLGDPDDPAALRLPAERDGTFWLRFGALGDQIEVDRRYVPAHRLFHADFDPARIASKIAIVAVLEFGTADERLSPLGQVVYGVETHVQMIEQILGRDFLRRPWFIGGVEAALMIAACLGVIALVPVLRPELSAGLIAAGIALLLVGGYAAFRAGLLIDTATPAIGVFVVTAGVLTATLIERDRSRLVSELALAGERADRAQLQGELDAAARMQRAFLPERRLVLPGRLDLAAHIEPARQVGGDFYDHVMLDERHLFFLVADVSGKGADASQFMLLSKTLWKSVALRCARALAQVPIAPAGPGPVSPAQAGIHAADRGDPRFRGGDVVGGDVAARSERVLAAIQAEANAEITRENAATMFVTGLSGLYDTATRLLAYSSAGHDAPIILRAGRPPARLAIDAGPPLGLVPGAAYPVGTCRLAPGDRLCLFSDGASEAMDADGRVFGIDRLQAALGETPPGADSAAIIAHVVARIAAFSGRAEQSDDLTLLVLSVPA